MMVNSNFINAETLNAESFVFKSNGSVHDTDGWKIDENGYIGTLIRITSETLVKIKVRANGQKLQNFEPIMSICIADTKSAFIVQSKDNPPFTEYKEYNSEFSLKPGTYSLRIEHTKNSSYAGNRNLYIKDVTFSGGNFLLINNPTDEDVLAAADTYIEYYRKGNAKIKIYDENGEPLSSGVAVDFKLKNHKFNFGTEVYGTGADFLPVDWADPNPPADSDFFKYQEFIKNHFNIIVPSNAGKWAYHEAERGVLTLDGMDKILDFAETNGIRGRMHGVIFDSKPQQPEWVNALIEEAKTDENKKNELREEISKRIDYMVADRALRWTDIDVVNEPVHTGDYFNIFGYDGLADIYNESAQKANGRALGYINEYGALQHNENDLYNNWYKDHIQKTLAVGGKIEGVGFQYYAKPENHSPLVVHRCLQNFCTLNLPMKLTEFGVETGVSNEDAAKILNEMMRLVFGCEKMDSFILWGFWKTWMWHKMSAAYLTDENWNKSECGKVFDELMKKWYTEGSCITNKSGEIEFNGFYGEYTFLINGKEYNFNLEKGKKDYSIQL
ncbi:MAG: endo-1,4-beta-xylanase [Armatimonadota bacterium]